jgi:2-oxoglutarate dehydrogenase complex dehydrogenase (E1) component-like enzyme
LSIPQTVSAYIVAIPRKPVSHIQNIAPGPPTKIAPAASTTYSAIILKNSTASTFNVNGDDYVISDKSSSKNTILNYKKKFASPFLGSRTIFS